MDGPRLTATTHSDRTWKLSVSLCTLTTDALFSVASKQPSELVHQLRNGRLFMENCAAVSTEPISTSRQSLHSVMILSEMSHRTGATTLV